jgi:hypothetical protein
MKMPFLILSLLLLGCTSFGRQVGSLGERELYEDPNQKIGVATISQRPLPIRGDPINVHSWQHVFGRDPDIRVVTYGKNIPNPFSPPPSIQIINLAADTLTITIVEDEDIPAATIYRGFIERGRIDIRIELSPKHRTRKHLVDLNVGGETKRVSFIDLR